MDHFPHPELTKVPNNPSFQHIDLLQREAYANVSSVNTSLGGGHHGYLGLLMPDAEYQAISHGGTAFQAPDFPGPQDAHAEDTTAHAIVEANQQYGKDLKTFRECEDVRDAIRKLLLDAIPSHLIQELATDVRGMAAVQPRAILTHMVTNYGAASQDDIEDNRHRLTEDWNPDDGLAAHWAKVQSIRSFADAAGEPISGAVTVRLTLRVLEKSGVFSNAVQKWKDKPAADRTWANFKPHFNAAERQRLRSLTAAQAGNHEAAAATRPPAPTPTPGSDTTPPHVTTNNGVKMHCCWTHGLGKNRNHTSATCNNKAEGHKDDATADNMMGGNNKIMTARARNA